MVIKVAGATGATSRYTATDRELLKEAGDGTLQIRDMHLVNPNARGQSMGFLVRQDSVLISLFGVKALLKSDACYLLEAQKPHVANTAAAIQLALGGREYREGRKPFELITDRVPDSGGRSLAERVAAKLSRDDQLVTELGAPILGATLHQELGQLWRDKGEISVGELWGYFTRYVYLPRLVQRESCSRRSTDGFDVRKR